MKFRSLAHLSPFPKYAVIACASLSAVAELKADSATWLAAPANGNWAEATNWVGGIAPGATTGTTNTDTATFGTSSVVAVIADENRNLQNITYSSNTSVYTISGGPLLLTSGGTLLSTNVAQDQRITAPIVLQGEGGTYKFQTDTPGSNREIIISAGGITGASTATFNTALTLAGTSTGSNAISSVIGDGTGGGTLSLVKEGASLWILSSGANTYSGGTTVSGGTLRSDNSGNSSVALGTGPVTINGGSLRFQSSSGATFNNGLATTANGGSISMRANSTFNPPSITGTGTFTLTADANVTVTTTSFQNFAGTLNLGTGVTNFFRLGTGYIENSLALAAVNLAAGAQIGHQAGTNSLTFGTTQIGTLSGAAGSFIGGSGAGSGTFTFEVGGRNESSTFSGVIGNGGTPTALTKIGTGTLTLTGVNTYTRTTSVTGGVLSLTTPCLADTSTVSVNGGVLNLNFVGSDVIASLSLGGGAVPPGTYSATTPGYEGFITGTGSLRVGLPPLYNEWAAGYGLENPWVTLENPALNGEPTGDPDSDGQPNSSEFALGGSPVSGSNNAKIYSLTADSDVDVDTTPELLLSIAVLDGTVPFSNTAAPTATYDGYTYTIQGSLTLDAFTTAATPTTTPVTTGLPTAPVGYNYRTFSLSGSNGLTGKGFLRAVITNP